MYSRKILILAPSRKAISETFIRANLKELPFKKISFFGDEYDLDDPLKFIYGVSILISKLLTRLRLYKLSTLPSSVIVYLILKIYNPDLILVEFGFHAIRVMESSFWSKIPLIVHFRGSDASSNSKFKCMIFFLTLDTKFNSLIDTLLLTTYHFNSAESINKVVL